MDRDGITAESYYFIESSDRWIKVVYTAGKFENVDFMQGFESKKELFCRGTAYALTNYLNKQYCLDGGGFTPNIMEIDEDIWEWFRIVTDHDDVEWAKERYLEAQ
mgnify:FL=1